MNYKDDFNEWALKFWEENDRDPTLEECRLFEELWMDDRYDLADIYKGEIRC